MAKRAVTVATQRGWTFTEIAEDACVKVPVISAVYNSDFLPNRGPGKVKRCDLNALILWFRQVSAPQMREEAAQCSQEAR